MSTQENQTEKKTLQDLKEGEKKEDLNGYFVLNLSQINKIAKITREMSKKDYHGIRQCECVTLRVKISPIEDDNKAYQVRSYNMIIDGKRV